jgi:hypothetical protein
MEDIYFNLATDDYLFFQFGRLNNSLMHGILCKVKDKRLDVIMVKKVLASWVNSVLLS